MPRLQAVVNLLDEHLGWVIEADIKEALVARGSALPKASMVIKKFLICL